MVSQFPADLANKALEYSGLYEDGWMAEHGFLRLAGPPRPTRFVVRGVSPWNPTTSGVSDVVVRINGIEKARQGLRQGTFEISFDIEFLRETDPG